MKNIILIAIAALFLSASCDPAEREAKTNPYKPLNLSAKSAEFVNEGTRVFTFNFLDRINASAEGSYFLSPLSMQLLLAMTLNGAQGETANQISGVLGYGGGDEIEDVNVLAQELLSQLPTLDKKTKLTIANAIFVDNGNTLLDTYVSALKQSYNAVVENLDFTDNAGSTGRINDWCSQNTNGLFPKILDRVDPDMLAYLLNAMYFKSQWSEKFDKKNTSEEPFYREGVTETSPVPMMKINKKYGYTENEVFQAVQIPYGNKAFAMMVLKPQSGHKVSEITSFLKTSTWEDFRAQFDTYDVDLWLPRFTTQSHFDLKKTLSAMGMRAAFDPCTANFSKMALPTPYLDAVFQDAIVKVDEEGTEVAVVSRAHFGKGAAAPDMHAVFHADHTFLYLITESSTGAVLFAGRYEGD